MQQKMLIYVCSTVMNDDTEAIGVLNQSKPDLVDRPLRTARTFVHHYNAIQYCSRETVL